MKFSIYLILSLSLSLGIVFADETQCGKDNLCPNNFCCSSWGFCGNESAWCCGDCQSQCWTPSQCGLPSPTPPPPPPSAPPPPSPRPDFRCGKPYDNPPCEQGKCCSIWNWCDNTPLHCQSSTCQYQCWPHLTDLPLALLQNYNNNNVNAMKKMISKSLFNEMFKHRKDCPSQGFYSYEAFIAAVASFPGFGTTGDVTTRKRELAAFFGQTSQATTGEWTDSKDPHAWGYCHVNGTTADENDYCTSSHWPCASGKKYNARGPIQLTHNYNYGLAGGALEIDLINNPDLVATDPVVSFKTAIWFWMTQHHNKPSCHDILINACSGANQVPNYGVIGNIINGIFEHRTDTITNSIEYYKRYCDMLEVSYGEDLNNWYDQASFSGDSHIRMTVL